MRIVCWFFVCLFFSYVTSILKPFHNSQTTATYRCLTDSPALKMMFTTQHPLPLSPTVHLHPLPAPFSASASSLQLRRRSFVSTTAAVTINYRTHSRALVCTRHTVLNKLGKRLAEDEHFVGGWSVYNYSLLDSCPKIVGAAPSLCLCLSVCLCFSASVSVCLFLSVSVSLCL